MPRIQHLDEIAQERGTYPVKFTFKDKLRQDILAAAMPTCRWWLTDMTGTAINSRIGAVISEITNPLYVVLSADDLQILDKNNGYEDRLLTLMGTYDSDIGNALPFTYAVSFTILNNLVMPSHLNVLVVDAVVADDVTYV